MKLFTTCILFVFSLSINSILANAESAEKAEAYCTCIKNAKKANNVTDKKNCSQVKDKHIQELVKNSPEYNSYMNLINSCDK